MKRRTPAARYRADSHPDYVDFDYLKNAETVYEWMARELFDRTTGQVYGSFSQKKGKMTAYSLTYDQGTFLGAAHLLYRYTGKKLYRDDALKAALYTITHPGITKGGMLRDEGAGGDNSFFKGIFIRYAVELVPASSSTTSSATRPKPSGRRDSGATLPEIPRDSSPPTGASIRNRRPAKAPNIRSRDWAGRSAAPRCWKP